MKFHLFVFQSVAGIPSSFPRESLLRRKIEKNRKVYFNVADGKSVKSFHFFGSQSAGISLVSGSRIDISVAKYDITAFKLGLNKTLSVLTACGDVQQKLGNVIHVFIFGVKYNAANLFGNRRTARLARENRLYSAQREIFF